MSVDGDRSPVGRVIASRGVVPILAALCIGGAFGPQALAKPAAEAHAVAAGFRFGADATHTTYGAERGVNFSGRLTGVSAAQTVTVLSRPCGFTSGTPVMKLKTGKGGTFRFSLQPGLNTTFSVRWRTLTRSVRITVQPRVVLTRDSAGGYRVDVSTTNGVFLDGLQATIQSWDANAWVSAGSATLAANSPPDEMTAVSSGIFAGSLNGVKLRALLPSTECYTGGASTGIVG